MFYLNWFNLNGGLGAVLLVLTSAWKGRYANWRNFSMQDVSYAVMENNCRNILGKIPRRTLKSGCNRILWGIIEEIHKTTYWKNTQKLIEEEFLKKSSKEFSEGI